MKSIESILEDIHVPLNDATKRRLAAVPGLPPSHAGAQSAGSPRPGAAGERSRRQTRGGLAAGPVAPRRSAAWLDFAVIMRAEQQGWASEFMCEGWRLDGDSGVAAVLIDHAEHATCHTVAQPGTQRMVMQAHRAAQPGCSAFRYYESRAIIGNPMSACHTSSCCQSTVRCIHIQM